MSLGEIYENASGNDVYIRARARARGPAEKQSIIFFPFLVEGMKNNDVKLLNISIIDL